MAVIPAVTAAATGAEAVADIPVHHLDGFDTWEGVNDGRCVKDMWF